MRSVLLAFQSDQALAVMKNALAQCGYSIPAECKSGSEVVRTVGRMGGRVPIVVCGFRLGDMTAKDLYEMLPPGTNMVVLLSQAQGALRYEFPSEVLTLNLPVSRSDLLQTLDNIASISEEEFIPGERVHRTEDEKRIIEEAKSLLMDRHLMTESQAHRYLQRQSMNNGRKMVETAALILSRGK